MDFDVLSIGAGPGGIFTAYELTEKAEKPQKAERAGKPGKKDAVEKGQVTVWDLIEGRQPDSAE